MKARRTSLEGDRDRSFGVIGDDDALGVVSLVTEWDRKSILGVVMGEREGDLGESGKSERCAGVFCVFCGGGMICAGRSGGARDFFLLRLRQGGCL